MTGAAAYGRILATLTWAEFKLKDQGTVIGFFWTLLHPALMFVILYLLFTRWMAGHVENYPAYLIIGLVNWQFFEKSTSHSLSSLKRKAALLRNFNFPREIVVLSAFGSVLIAHLIELAVLLPFLAVVGVPPGIRWLLLPLPLLLGLAVALGFSMVLSMLALVIEDMGRIWSILATSLFFLTPVFYPVSVLSQRERSLALLNPLAQVLDCFRSVLLGTPVGSAVRVAAVFAGAALLCALSLAWFRRNSLRLMDRVLAP